MISLTLTDDLSAAYSSFSPADDFGETGGASAGELLEEEEGSFCSVSEASMISCCPCCWHKLMGGGREMQAMLNTAAVAA